MKDQLLCPYQNPETRICPYAIGTVEDPRNATRVQPSAILEQNPGSTPSHGISKECKTCGLRLILNNKGDKVRISLNESSL